MGSKKWDQDFFYTKISGQPDKLDVWVQINWTIAVQYISLRKCTISHLDGVISHFSHVQLSRDSLESVAGQKFLNGFIGGSFRATSE